MSRPQTAPGRGHGPEHTTPEGATVSSFAIGDRVRIGRGKVEWTITAFGTWPISRERYAELKAVEGYANTTATLDRLVACP